MWIAFYNKAAVGDVLMLTKESIDKNHVDTESNSNITLIKNRLTNEVVSVNIFNISESLDIQGVGNIELTDQERTIVNEKIKEAGFDLTIEFDNRPKFVVGHVESSEKLKDSDHLSLTQVNVGDTTLQIVCGASNIAQGQEVIVARHGAVLPSGSIIWNGQLRGTDSYGMICSTRELNLSDIEDLPGIWELNKSFEAGTPLEKVIEAYS